MMPGHPEKLLTTCMELHYLRGDVLCPNMQNPAEAYEGHKCKNKAKAAKSRPGHVAGTQGRLHYDAWAP